MMNERIQELALAAGKYADETQPRGSYTRDGMWLYAYNEKLAELLLRDVMELQCLSEWKRHEICSSYGLEYKPKMMKRPSYGDLFTEDEWLEASDAGYFISDDGSGYWATETEYAHISCWDEKPEWATHVLWFNK